MIRLTMFLVAAMAIVAIATGERSPQPSSKTAAISDAAPTPDPEQQASQTSAPPQEPTETFSVVHAEGVTIREYARSDSPEYLHKMINMGGSDAPADARIRQASLTDSDQPRIFQVNGNRVNLRSGPSTSNNVVASLVRGTEVEILAHHGSWAELVVLDSAEIGYMSASFLQAAN